MAEHNVPLAPPHEAREQILSTTAFTSALAKRGWTIKRMRSAYTDPLVFRQQWLVCPNGRHYRERHFYDAFNSNSWRKLFRYTFAHIPCTREELEQKCPQQETLTRLLTFLQDQEWLYFNGHQFKRGTYQHHIRDIGRTLEWYVAEWFRLNYHFTSVAPAFHGVELAEMPLQGDLDVVAILNETLFVMVECKSTNAVDWGDCHNFLLRVQAFQPDMAILLIDTPSPFSDERIATFNLALSALGYPPLIGKKGLYRGPLNIYMVNVEHSLEITLRGVLELSCLP